MKKFLGKFWIDRRAGLILLGVGFLLVLFLASKMAFWVFLFIAAASVSEMYNAYFRTPLHLDLVKLGTILTAVAFGAPAGMFVGLTSTLLSKLFSLRIDARIVLSFAGIILVAVLADVFSGVSISLLGILLVVAYYAVTSPINILLGEEPAYALAYVGSSLLVNAFLFIAIAPRLLPLL
jgi:hypothetical protein